MDFFTKIQRCITIEEAVLLAIDHKLHLNIESFEQWVGNDWDHYVTLTDETHIPCTLSAKSEIMSHVHRLYSLFKNEALRAIEYDEYETQMRNFDNLDSDIRYDSIAPSTVYEANLTACDVRYDGKIPCLKTSTFTRQSFVNWMNDNECSSIASRIAGDFSQHEPTRISTVYEEDDTPTNLYIAYSVYKELWKNLPKNMNGPSKAQIENYIRAKGIKVSATIDAIIKLSLPDDVSLGGKPDPNKLAWDMQNYHQHQK